MSEDFDVSKIESVSLDDLFKEMDERREKRPRLIKWIDTWFGGSLAGYRVSYSIIRPHLVIEEWWRQILWAWQRVFRGWDDRASWSVDYWLDDKMIEILTRLKETKHGTPMSFFDGFDYNENYEYSDEDHKKANALWDAEIDKMISAFKASKELEEVVFVTKEQYFAECERLNSVFEEGMKSFTKYYKALWD